MNVAFWKGAEYGDEYFSARAKKRQFTLAVQVWMLAGKGDAVFAECYGWSVIRKWLSSVRRLPFVFHRFKTA